MKFEALASCIQQEIDLAEYVVKTARAVIEARPTLVENKERKGELFECGEAFITRRQECLRLNKKLFESISITRSACRCLFRTLRDRLSPSSRDAVDVLMAAATRNRVRADCKSVTVVTEESLIDYCTLIKRHDASTLALFSHMRACPDGEVSIPWARDFTTLLYQHMTTWRELVAFVKSDRV